jgi:hypothetical protein
MKERKEKERKGKKERQQPHSRTDFHSQALSDTRSDVTHFL